MEISARAAQLTPSADSSDRQQSESNESRRSGCLRIRAGEPDFDTPEHIKTAAIDALHAGFTKYTPERWHPELRLAIAEKLAADNGLTYRAGQIVVQQRREARLLQRDPRDLSAGRRSHHSGTLLGELSRHGAARRSEPVILPTMERNGWKMRPEDFENAMTPRTKMLIMNTPGNPTAQPGRAHPHHP